MEENFTNEVEIIEDKLGYCVKCGRELTESNIYPNSKRPMCKSCAHELLEQRRERESKNNKKNILEKLKGLSKSKLIAVIASASVFVLTAIILLCYFTIPVKVEKEDAKDGFRLALYETISREQFTATLKSDKEGDLAECVYAFNKNGDLWTTESWWEEDNIGQGGGYLSVEERKLYSWEEHEINGKIEEEAYWGKITNSEIKEITREGKDEVKSISSDINWNDFLKAYKRGGVTTVLFAGDGFNTTDYYTSNDTYEMTVKFEKNFIKRIEIIIEDDEGIETQIITFNKKYKEIELNRDFTELTRD